MPKKIYLTILKSGIYLSFLSVFLVSGKLFFPYITTKQIFFNILTEILFFFWLVFIIQYPSYRPFIFVKGGLKKSLIPLGLVSFFIIITLSSILGVDFNLSFWGDAERMLGVFHVLHFLAFYFIIITVMLSWKDWYALMLVSVAAAAFVSIHALTVIVYSTVGNAAYVGGYLIFNIYFSLILFFRTDKKIFWRWLYPAAIILMLFALKNTGVAGAYVGLGSSAILALFLFGLLSRDKKVKIYILSAAVLSIVLITGIFLYRNNSTVRGVKFLDDVLSEISVGKNTFQTRLISWKTAWKDFPAHPLLGTGYGNFAITFDKYFDPSFYNYTRSETYFDRAHNNLIDIASTSGALGLLAYLSIFAAAGYYLVIGYRKDKIKLHDFVLLISLIIAYFVQNLAVFDSLVTYIPLMAMLGYIYWLARNDQEIDYIKDDSFNNKEIFAGFLIGLSVLIILFKYNIGPLRTFIGTIKGQIAFAQGDIAGGVEIYKGALSRHTVLDRDSRDSLVRSMTSVLLNESVSQSQLEDVLAFVEKMAEENIKYNPKDSLTQTELAQFFISAAQASKDDNEKFFSYLNQAMEAANKAIDSSPGRIPLYYVKAQIYKMRGDSDNAIVTLEYAAGLNEKYYDSFCNLAKYYFMARNEEKGFSAMDKCIDLGGAELLTPVDYVISLINFYIDKQNDWPRVVKLYERLVKMQPDQAVNWVKLAASYERIGEYGKAIEAARKSVELDPTLKDEVEQFINALGKISL